MLCSAGVSVVAACRIELRLSSRAAVNFMVFSFFFGGGCGGGAGFSLPRRLSLRFGTGAEAPDPEGAPRLKPAPQSSLVIRAEASRADGATGKAGAGVVGASAPVVGRRHERESGGWRDRRHVDAVADRGGV